MSSPVVVFPAVTVLLVVPDHDLVKGVGRADHGRRLKDPQLGHEADGIDDDHEDGPHEDPIAPGFFSG